MIYITVAACEPCSIQIMRVRLCPVDTSWLEEHAHTHTEYTVHSRCLSGVCAAVGQARAHARKWKKICFSNGVIREFVHDIIIMWIMFFFPPLVYFHSTCVLFIVVLLRTTLTENECISYTSEVRAAAPISHCIFFLVCVCVRANRGGGARVR